MPTFFRPPLRRKATTLVAPVLREAVLAAEAEQGEHLLVYQTAAGSETLVRTLHETGLPCRLYGVRRDLTEDLVDGELVYRPFSESVFLEDLRTARGVIAGGGFSLLSECVYLHKPALSIPVAGQFEQTLNARYLERLGYGEYAAAPSPRPSAPSSERLPDHERALADYEQDGNHRGARRAARAARARGARARGRSVGAPARPSPAAEPRPTPSARAPTRRGARVTLAVAAPLLCLLALVIALVEIEIEGPYGWAEKLPTPYRVSGPLARLFGLVLGGKPLTGYNLLMFASTLVAFHLPFAFGAPWTAARELALLAAWIAWSALWDFLWFLLNPAYGWRRFRPGNVWWHRRWLWRLPLDYWVAVVRRCAGARGAARRGGGTGRDAAAPPGSAGRWRRRRCCSPPSPSGRCSPACLAALRPALRAHARGRLRRARPRAHHAAARRGSAAGRGCASACGSALFACGSARSACGRRAGVAGGGWRPPRAPLRSHDARQVQQLICHADRVPFRTTVA